MAATIRENTLCWCCRYNDSGRRAAVGTLGSRGEWRGDRGTIHVREWTYTRNSSEPLLRQGIAARVQKKPLANLLYLSLSLSPPNFFSNTSTIPIAKRRYYGRVQQAVHEFLEMGADFVKGADMTGQKVQTFFDPQGIVVVAAKRKDVNGQCTKKDGNCKGQEIRDSRYNDMKASMYLLGNAFRTDQQKPPDRLRKCMMIRSS